MCSTPRSNTLRELNEALNKGRRPDELRHARFDVSHELFERSSNQQQLILDWLSNLIRSHDDTSEPLKILSVGCGSGILDNPLIDSIASGHSRRINYTGVDPNRIACQRFADDFAAMHLDNVRLSLRQHGVESLDSGERFHIIHLVHSLYYFEDPAQTLDHLVQLLEPHGKLVIVQAPEAELNQLAKCFWRYHTAGPIWFSDTLARHLAAGNLQFTEHRIQGEVNLEPCFVSDCPRGAMLMDFVTQSECQHLDAQVLSLCRRFLRSISRQEEDGLFAPHPADAFLITA